MHNVSRVLLAGPLQAKVLVGEVSCYPAARRTIKEADLYQERLIHLFDGVSLFRQSCRQRIQPDGPSLVFLDDGHQQFAVNLIEAVLIDFQHL